MVEEERRDQVLLGHQGVQLVHWDLQVRNIHWVLGVLVLLDHRANLGILDLLEVRVDLELQVVEEVVVVEVVVHMALVPALEEASRSTSVRSQGHNQHHSHHCRRIVYGLKTQMRVK